MEAITSRRLSMMMTSLILALPVLVTPLIGCSAREIPPLHVEEGFKPSRSLMQDTSTCNVQCTPPPSPSGTPGKPYCCPAGAQCQGDASSGSCERIGGGGSPIPPLVLANVTEASANRYKTGDPNSGPNPCNFNGVTWYCPATLNCGRSYLDCLPSNNFLSLVNSGY
eukprot:TRINITY_DN105_c0_g1_i3.p1 TRINITY_DN105_c0_g1~~TRINITY_DN105_c0_g1_i3.p1  ORF type:complete len:167 (-),score=0.79 TRINITY_DN105_c0_g1_i3:530-1030(-)